MARVTQKGRKLAEQIGGEWNRERLEICSLLCRAATSYARIQECICNGHPANGNPAISAEQVAKMQTRWEKWCDKRDSQLEKRIRELAAELPEVKAVVFNGDPRGATVKLAMVDGRTDDWGQVGICVPGA